MTRPARLAVALASLSVPAGWLLWIAVVTDFDEQAVLVLGALLAVAACAAFWRPRRQAPRFAVLAVCGAAMIAFGLHARTTAIAQQEINRVVTQNIAEHVARALHAYHDRAQAYPDVDWPALRALLPEAGAWTPLEMVDARDGRRERFANVPRKDAWGCKFEYRRLGDDAFRLRSSGADRRWDTADDIVIEQDAPLPETPRPLPASSGRWFDPNRG